MIFETVTFACDAEGCLVSHAGTQERSRGHALSSTWKSAHTEGWRVRLVERQQQWLCPTHARHLRIGSLFSGYGGLDLAAEAFFGATTAWHVEYDAAPSRVLAERWPGVPNHGDVTSVDWSTVERVDILCGGFPCQDLSLAGRRAGMREGTRSGLWSDFLKAINVLQPQVVVIENVRGLLSGCAESDMEPCPGCLGVGEHRPVLRALGRVLGDLAELGFDAEWGGVRASDVGAPHGRFRVFVLAHRPGVGREWAGVARRGWAGSAHSGDAPLALLPTPRAADGPKGAVSATATTARRVADGRANLAEASLHLMPTPQVADATGGHASRSGARSDEPLLPGVAAQAQRSGFGPYEAAVRRWEALTREAPSPTLPNGRDGAHRLNAAFAEWMMGLPAGWVTDVLERTASLKALGNGVVPQQAHAALEALWDRVDEAVAA